LGNPGEAFPSESYRVPTNPMFLALIQIGVVVWFI